MEPLLYLLSLHLHLQAKLVFDWREDGGHRMKPVPVTPRGHLLSSSTPSMLWA